MTTLPATHRRIVLASRPQGMVSLENFRLEEVPVPTPGPGQILVRQIYQSLDPYMRGRMNDGPSYAPPVPVGGVMEAGGVGEIVASQHPDWKVGDIVEGRLGWQEYVVPPYERLRRVNPKHGPISTANGVLGMPGMTAYFGLLDVGQPQPGDTVVVSAASGAVGAVVGQIARIMGCRVVGLVGSQAKADYIVNELGFDAAINYRTENLMQALARECPRGIDVYFENVGGAIWDAVVEHLALGARVAVCGRIAEYNLAEPELVPRNMRFFIPKRVRMQGFLVFDFASRHPEATARMARWTKEGQIKYREDVVEGIENAPAAFLKLFSGENFGKLLVKVGAEPA
jgi:NADPH-dependent curcumin reductase CurA